MKQKNIVRLALALELLALWCEHCVPGCGAFLPFGGDHFAQLAAFVVLGVIVSEICEIFGLGRGE